MDPQRSVDLFVERWVKFGIVGWERLAAVLPEMGRMEIGRCCRIHPASGAERRAWLSSACRRDIWSTPAAVSGDGVLPRL